MSQRGSGFGGLLVGLGLIGIGAVAFFFAGTNKKFDLDDIFPKPKPKPEPDGNGDGGDGGGGTDTGGSCTFAAAGDWGSGRNSRWKQTLALAKSAGAKLIVGLGDYSYTKANDWEPVVAQAKKDGMDVKISEGNHDSSSYAKTTGQPSMLHAFDCGPARIVLLNTESSPSSNANFLEKEMKATKKAWKVVAFHKCLYTNSSDHGEESGLKSAISPIIKKYGIQLVLYAHNHNYQRFQFGDHKTMYVCAGTGGESHYGIKGSKSGTKYTNDSDYGILKVSISGSKLSGAFVTHGGSTKDSFSLNASDFKVANLAYAYVAPRISI